MNLLRYRRAVVAALATTALLGAAGVTTAESASAAETHAQKQAQGHGKGHGKARHTSWNTLRGAAAASDRFAGVAVNADKLDDPVYEEIVREQFNSITPENAMKWESVEPERGRYDWAAADRIADYADANGQQLYGHVLVWHSQLPAWLGEGDFDAAELREIMTDHIATEAGRYRGRVDRWDVVNEAFNEDGTFRETVFYDKLGEDYIADAFRAAHKADPEAELYINDYNTDGLGPKSDGMYELVKKLKAEGVPIHGVGFQGHLVLGQEPDSMRANLQRFADLGVDVVVTELDIRMETPATEQKLRQQAREYKAVTDACLAVDRCDGVTVWGASDADSWIPGWFEGEGAALLYDEEYQRKPAYYATRLAFQIEGLKHLWPRRH
ncbi:MULTISPECIES: endo-1,4-beta-xylanase [Streptomyces]|uniref:Beta-xylanase n=1 Tax=Streptomyces lycii TaxID=2654337 RepID=A0ABQ7FND1_9ACTN|nr:MULTISPECIES: endo-1,4-beta-xylanase [Streptomyces]KAF4410222.1 endo-1,4-beta-xylanase [Streptomyces lycii]PGH50485.1 1,4-beta-xylanase [Streptomyces sp. Ru87]